VSHFTVTVKITAKRLAANGGDVEKTVADMLAPYNENNTDQFVDEEDELRDQYANESTERIQCPDGELLLPWDNRFRVPGSLGIGWNTHEAPADYPRLQVPFKETYATFEAFAKGWHGKDERDPKHGRYGHWTNPQGYWDWHTIGGRWSGFYPVKADAAIRLGRPGTFDNQPEAGHSDIVRVSEIDMAAVEIESRRRMVKFWSEWKDLLLGKQFKAFDGPREWAMEIGLLHVVRGAYEAAGPHELAMPWSKGYPAISPDDDRYNWTDVAKILDVDTFEREYAAAFYSLATYAAVDNDGWHAPGRMGWFGVSHAKSDSKIAFQREFKGRFIDNSQPDDTLVCVDCHV